MTNPMWRSVLAAASLALAVALTRVAPAPGDEHLAPTAPPDPAALLPSQSGQVIALASGPNAGLAAAPRDDGDEGGDGDDGGDDNDDTVEG